MRSHLFSSLCRRSGLLLGLVFLLATKVSAEPLMNGLAAHSELGKERFIAALYVDNPSTAPSTLLSANGTAMTSCREFLCGPLRRPRR